MRIARNQFDNLLEPSQATFVLNWGIHHDYKIVAGTIYGEGDDGFAYQPLKVPDLYRSFVCLAARGEPGEASIRKWVAKYGLLSWTLAITLHSKPRRLAFP